MLYLYAFLMILSLFGSGISMLSLGLFQETRMVAGIALPAFIALGWFSSTMLHKHESA